MTEGGPNYATETLPIMIYRYSMKKFNVGAASALSTMMFTVMTILFVFYYRKREKIKQPGRLRKGAGKKWAVKKTRAAVFRRYLHSDQHSGGHLCFPILLDADFCIETEG